MLVKSLKEEVIQKAKKDATQFILHNDNARTYPNLPYRDTLVLIYQVPEDSYLLCKPDCQTAYFDLQRETVSGEVNYYRGSGLFSRECIGGGMTPRNDYWVWLRDVNKYPRVDEEMDILSGGDYFMVYFHSPTQIEDIHFYMECWILQGEV